MQSRRAFAVYDDPDVPVVVRLAVASDGPEVPGHAGREPAGVPLIAVIAQERCPDESGAAMVDFAFVCCRQQIFAALLRRLSVAVVWLLLHRVLVLRLFAQFLQAQPVLCGQAEY